MIIDEYDGWLVIDIQKFKEAIAKLPPEYRKFKLIQKFTGVGRKQFLDYMNGKRLPNLLTLKKLCLYAQISSDELLGLKQSDNT
jgi:hypothetical protein